MKDLLIAVKGPIEGLQNVLAHKNLPAELFTTIDNDGETAVIKALMTLNQPLFELILAHPSFPPSCFTQLDREGRNLLQLAIEEGSIQNDYEAVRVVIQHRLFPANGFTQLNKSGDSALMLCVIKNYIEDVPHLLNAPTFPLEAYTQCNAHGHNPLMLAIASGNLMMLQLFLQQPNLPMECFTQRDNAGCNALMLAAEKGQKEIIDALLTCPRMPIKVLEAKRTSDDATFVSILKQAPNLTPAEIDLLLKRPLVTVPEQFKQCMAPPATSYFSYIPLASSFFSQKSDVTEPMRQFAFELIAKPSVTLNMMRSAMLTFDSTLPTKQGTFGTIFRALPSPANEKLDLEIEEFISVSSSDKSTL